MSNQEADSIAQVLIQTLVHWCYGVFRQLDIVGNAI